MRTRYDRVVIISAESGNNSLRRNELYTTALETSLKRHNFRYTRCLGSYKDCIENSFLVIIPDDSAEEYLRFLGILYDQESILVQDEEGRARLDYIIGTGEISHSESLGQLKPITKEQAEKLDAYTFLPSNNTYWSAS